MSESYNFNYRLSLTDPEQKIMETIDSSELPLTPKEIADKTEINHNSVKVYLRSLKKRNFVVQPFRGEYVSAKKVLTFDGSIGGRVTEFPRVHALRLKFKDALNRNGLVKQLDYGVCSVTIVIGTNGVANVLVDCHKGVSLDYTAFRLLIASLRYELNVPANGDVEVTSFELNIDHAGLRLDGVQALTLKAFDGSFERLYNKRRNLLRSEVKAVGSTSPESVYQLLKGGVGPYNIMQGLALLVNEIRQEREAQKFTNRILSDLLKKIGGRVTRVTEDSP